MMMKFLTILVVSFAALFCSNTIQAQVITEPMTYTGNNSRVWYWVWRGAPYTSWSGVGSLAEAMQFDIWYMAFSDYDVYLNWFGSSDVVAPNAATWNQQWRSIVSGQIAFINGQAIHANCVINGHDRVIPYGPNVWSESLRMRSLSMALSPNFYTLGGSVTPAFPGWMPAGVPGNWVGPSQEEYASGNFATFPMYLNQDWLWQWWNDHQSIIPMPRPEPPRVDAEFVEVLGWPGHSAMECQVDLRLKIRQPEQVWNNRVDIQIVINPPGQFRSVADFNLDFAVTVPDMFAFLSGWFAGNGRADINGNGICDVPDVFEFLGWWFEGIN